MERLPEPSAVHDISTGYGIVRVYEWSTSETAGGTPVMLIPGRSSGVPMWSPNLPGFAASHRVLAFDALGDAGLSVQSAPLTSVEEQAAWMDELISELSPGGVHSSDTPLAGRPLPPTHGCIRSGCIRSHCSNPS